MNICADGHDGICHEGRKCPLCEGKADWKSDAAKLDDEISSLKDSIASLEAELAEERNKEPVIRAMESVIQQ